MMVYIKRSVLEKFFPIVSWFDPGYVLVSFKQIFYASSRLAYAKDSVMY